MAEPPLLKGAAQVSMDEALPAKAATLVGAPGTLAETPKTVPVSWARVGLLVELRVVDKHAGGPTV